MSETSKGLEIQPATTNDLDAAWNIIDSCADWLVVEKGLDHWKNYYTRSLVDEKIRTQRVYLASLEGRPVATIALDFNPVNYYSPVDMRNFAKETARAGYVTALAVLPELQGRGIASRLMVFVEDRVSESKGEYIRLDCRATYGELVSFYSHRNFKTVGVIIDDEDNNAEYLLMEKPISL